MNCLLTDRNFVIANAQVENKPIIFCNDGFCELSGYARADVMQKPCTCDFLHGPLTSSYSIRHVKNALDGCDEQQVEAQYYKKDGKLHFVFCVCRKESELETAMCSTSNVALKPSRSE